MKKKMTHRFTQNIYKKKVRVIRGKKKETFKMKKKTIVVDILLDILLVLILVILSASLFAGEQPNDHLSQRVVKLKKDLELNDTQTANVREILEKDQNQAVKDRNAFKDNALNLIDAAFDRREETYLAINKLLNPGQKEKFKKISRMSFFERELFILTEGLLLTEEQAFTVEGILIDYFNKLDEMIPEDMRPGRDGETGGPEKPMGMRMGRMGGGGFFRGPGKDLKSKSDRAIKKILTKEQKKLFKQIKEDRRKKMKERMKERRKRFPLPSP